MHDSSKKCICMLFQKEQQFFQMTLPISLREPLHSGNAHFQYIYNQSQMNNI